MNLLYIHLISKLAGQHHNNVDIQYQPFGYFNSVQISDDVVPEDVLVQVAWLTVYSQIVQSVDSQNPFQPLQTGGKLC